MYFYAYNSSFGRVKNPRSNPASFSKAPVTPVVRPHICFIAGGVLAPAIGANECSALGGKDLRDRDHGSDPSLPTPPPSFLPQTTTLKETSWIPESPRWMARLQKELQILKRSGNGAKNLPPTQELRKISPQKTCLELRIDKSRQ